MSEPLIAFKAGRSLRREGTNFVDASPIKGAIYLFNEEGLVHFKWKNRATNAFEEDLILFPQDATFVKVSQSTAGRTYVLKFSSSSEMHFFWMQDASSTRDEEIVANVNSLLDDPERPLVWNAARAESSQPQASTSTSQPSSSSTAQQPTAEQLEQFRSLLASMATGNTASSAPDISLLDVLTPETLSPLFTNHPDLVSSLLPHLPPDLPVPPSAEVLQQIIASPQFRSAVRNFDQALHTGLLGGLVRGLGLPEEAGTGVEPFLRAVQAQAQASGNRQQGGSGESRTEEHDEMDTD